MADHRASSHPPNLISANTYNQPALYRLQHNPHVPAGDNLQGGHQEGILQPMGNVVMQGEMQNPRHIDAPHYNVAHYHLPLGPPPYPAVPYVHMNEDAEVVPVQAHHLAPEAHDGLYDYGAHLPVDDPLEAFPGVLPHAAPPADMPANGLRNLAGLFLNNPDTLINMLRISPGPGGHFVVWIELELATDLPGAFPGVQPHAAAHGDMPPANGLRNLAGRFINSPNTLVNMLRIEPGPGGCFMVLIELELADI